MSRPATRRARVSPLAPRAGSGRSLYPRVLAAAWLIASAWVVLSPTACTRTVCEDAIDICSEPIVDEFDVADCAGEFECVSLCVVENDTCVTNQLDECVAACTK